MAGRLAGRIALITGASRGIGAAIARAYAREGAHLILVARTSGALEEIDDEVQALGGSATLVPLDLLEWDNIDGLAAPLLERWGKLDIFVGNAAMLGRLSPMGHYPPDMWDKVFRLNVHANWRLIRALDPLLRQSDAGRVLFVTSGITRSLQPYWGPYAASKAALEAMALTYAAEVMKTPIRVNLINPGPARTKLRALAFPGEPPENVPAPDDLMAAFVAAVDPAFQHTGEWIAADQWGGAEVH
ncbi:SDR family NAD(P)-dependent oxidoreductase [Oceanibacterium hippocampi]|uniref:Putative oxidoreductase YciK n=1 Tax=Oceanibacterium hippocampi TaxID=745714 RepID=A0A1Y5SY35_9PROT|nr:SDR family NAD(P)-dependent oxidoreductase [Oceanibacterium hippocampi]SLN47845.1 putative oxidoreductase YciK [Oceanibacterium hippocampi]